MTQPVGGVDPPTHAQVLRAMAAQSNVGAVRRAALLEGARVMEQLSQRVTTYKVFGLTPRGMVAPVSFSAPEREKALAMAEQHNLTCLEETVRIVRDVRREEEAGGQSAQS